MVGRPPAEDPAPSPAERVRRRPRRASARLSLRARPRPGPRMSLRPARATLNPSRRQITAKVVFPQTHPPTGPNANCCDRLLEGVDERDPAGGADHRRRRVDLDHRQPPASLGHRVPSRVCAFSLTRCVSICFCQVSRLTIGGVAVMLVSFDACQVTSRMRTAGPQSGPRDQGEAGKPPGRYPHEA